MMRPRKGTDGALRQAANTRGAWSLGKPPPPKRKPKLKPSKSKGPS
jgi:hypothetical protein